MTLEDLHIELTALRRETIPPGATAYTVEQAGVLLGCRRRKIFELLKAGRLRGLPLIGRQRLISADSVRELLENPTGCATRGKAKRAPENAVETELAAITALQKRLKAQRES